MSTARPPDPIRFVSSDGTALVGDLIVPNDPVMAAIVCHPHPQYGGNRFHPVVAAIHRALPEVGIAALRFDVRSDFDGGVGELRDTHAALELVADRVPAVPTLAIGYSFGALMALGVAAETSAAVAIAPPLAMASDVAAPSVPCLLLAAEHDQFTNASSMREATAHWTDCSVEVLHDADHFLVGHDRSIAERVCTFATERLA
ncbi:MAG: alpha/beta hydrolase [Ilumatobacter sp.]